MNKNLRFILMTLFLVTYWTSFGQEKIVTGIVTDGSNQPLPGVTVMVKGGGTHGTTTDFDGNFSIELKEVENGLVFSYMGFITQTIEVKSKMKLVVVLKTDMVGLNEVVVVGYGAMKKSDLTGAVVSVSGDVLEKAASNRALEAIQGRVSGLSISKSSGRPGAGMKVRIRGVGSTNNSDPLYVIDGVPSGTDMESIAPEDIKSIEVLKDASSTAIYGNKGANGVIIITTKSGSASDKPVFSFNSYYGISEVAHKVDLLNAHQQATLILEASENDGISVPSILAARTGYVIANNYKGTDWQDKIFKTGEQKNYNLSVRGGFTGDNDRRITYSVSGTFYDEEGVVENTGFRKYILNSKTEYKFNSKVKIGVQLNLFRKEYGDFDEGLYNGPIPLALTTSPMDSGLDADGNFIATGTALGSNPMLVTDHLKYSNNSTNSYGLRTWFDYNLTDDLNFRTNFKLSRGYTYNKVYRPKFYLNENFYRAESELYEGRGDWYSWTWINLLNYKKEFNDVHKIIATLGQESSYDQNSGLSGTGINVPEESRLQYLNLAKKYKEQLGSWQGQGGSLSFFTRVFYSYQNKYMVTGTLRYDGSSKFTGDNKWGLFPSVGASWKIDEENFMQDNSVFSALKFRVGWGRVGNEASAQSGSDVASIGNYGMYYVFNNVTSQGGTTTNIPTPDLKWEIVETSNIGLDMGFLEGNLSVTADYFTKDTKDMITRVALPGYFPKDRPNANIGTMSNKGFEVSANYRKSINDFKFNFGANISVIDNKIEKLNSDSAAYIDGGFIHKIGNTTRTEAGREIAYFYGYKTAGIFRSQNEIDTYTNTEGDLIQPDAKVGDVKFVDNGDGVLNEDDKRYLGSGQADFTYGFNFSVEYKGIDFSGNIYGVQGAEIVNGMSSRLLGVSDYYNAYSNRMDRFHPVNNPNGTQPRVTLSDNNNNLRFSDRYVEDGSYLRLKNIQIGYTFPKIITEKMNIDKLRFYVSGQNLVTFTHYKGYDPEIGDLTFDADADAGSLGIGVDLGNYPQPRLYYFGVNLTF